jgi:hypothetical protein
MSSHAPYSLARKHDRTVAELSEASLTLRSIEEKRDPAKPATKRETALQAKVLRLKDRTKALNDARAIEPQKESYGPDWSKRFTTLTDLQPPNTWNGDRAAFVTAVWRAIPNCPWKRFQELFCNPREYVVPRGIIVDGNRISFQNNPDFSKASTHGCLVSPDRVSDTLATNLKLVEFASSDSAWNRTVKKSSIVVLDSLKLWWDSARPLDQGNARILVMHPPEEWRSARFPKALSFPEGLAGTILYSRESQTRRTPSENPLLTSRRGERQVQHFRSLLSALRRTLHVQDGYDTEQPELATLQSTLQDLQVRLQRDYKRTAAPAVKDTLRTEVTSALDQGIELLERCTNFRKSRAHTMLSKVQGMRDSLGRPNPTVTATMMETSLRDLSARLREASIIESYARQDQRTIAATLTRDGELFRKCRLTVAQNSSRIPQSIPAQDLLTLLAPHRDSLASITCQPLARHAEAIRAVCSKLETSPTRRVTRLDALTLGATIFQQTGIAATEICLGEILRKASSYPVDIQEIRSRAAQLRKAARSDPFGESSTAVNVFAALEEQVAELVGSLRAPRSKDSHAAWYRELREQVRAIAPSERNVPRNV